MGSSTNHVVRFDGLALRLDGEGLCSYTLLTVSKEIGEGSEVKLHTGPCQDSANYNQICMKAMEVTVGAYKLLLRDDMVVSCVCVFLNCLLCMCVHRIIYFLLGYAFVFAGID